MTYKEACDSISEVQIAVPCVLVLWKSSGKPNRFKNIDDVIHPATAYTYSTKNFPPQLHNHHSCDNGVLKPAHLTISSKHSTLCKFTSTKLTIQYTQQ